MPPKHLPDCGKVPPEGGMPRCAPGCPVHAARTQRRLEAQREPEAIDREAPTPRQSGSFAAFYKMSIELGQELRQAAQEAADRTVETGTDLRMGSLQFLRCELAWEMALALDALALRFAKWPEARPGVEAEAVAAERPVLTSRLLDLAREAKELCGEIRRG